MRTCWVCCIAISNAVSSQVSFVPERPNHKSMLKIRSSHLNVHSQNRPHYCPVKDCNRSEGGKGFKRKNEMIRHGLVHQSPGYICPFCPEGEHKYPRPDNLQRYVPRKSLPARPAYPTTQACSVPSWREGQRRPAAERSPRTTP